MILDVELLEFYLLLASFRCWQVFLLLKLIHTQSVFLFKFSNLVLVELDMKLLLCLVVKLDHLKFGFDAFITFTVSFLQRILHPFFIKQMVENLKALSPFVQVLCILRIKDTINCFATQDWSLRLLFFTVLTTERSTFQWLFEWWILFSRNVVIW